MFTTLRILGNALAVTAYIVLYATLAVLMLLMLLTPPGWVLTPFVAVFGYSVYHQAARRRGGAVVACVEQTVRLNLPLPESLRAAAASERGRLRLALSRLAQELSDGVPLADALARTVSELPERSRSLIRAGQDTGRLARALHRVTRQERRRHEEQSPSLGVIWGYPIAMGGASLVILLLICVMIIPKYEEIFTDFGAPLPAITLGLIGFGRWLVGTMHPGQAAPGALWVALIVLTAPVLMILARHGLLGSLPGRLLWYVPVVGQAQQAQAMGDACHVISDSLDGGVPLEDALDTAATLKVNPVAAGRLKHWAHRVREGRPMHEAAAQARLPGLVTGILATAQTAGNLPAALAFCARYYDARQSWLAALLRGSVIPAMVLAFALLIGWIVIALFLPVSELIWSMIPAAQGVDL